MDWDSALKLRDLEQQNGLPQGFLSAVMHAESAGDPTAKSKSGATGLFQFMPDTAKQYGIDPADPQQAAEGAARMYGDLSKKYNGDMPKMLAGYNWGQGHLDRNGIEQAPKETKDYIDKITTAMGGGSPQQQSDLGYTAGGIPSITVRPQDQKVNYPDQGTPTNSQGGFGDTLSKAVGQLGISSAQAAEMPNDRSVQTQELAPLNQPQSGPSLEELEAEAKRRGLDAGAAQPPVAGQDYSLDDLMAEAKRRGLNISDAPPERRKLQAPPEYQGTPSGIIDPQALADKTLDTLTFGLSNKAVPAIAAGVNTLRNGQSFGDNYTNAKDYYDQRLAQEQEKSPMSSLAGLATGGVLNYEALAGMFPKTASAIGQYAKANPWKAGAAIGTALGAAQGAGGSPDLASVPENTLKGGGFGALAGLAGTAIGKAADQGLSYLAPKAESAFAKVAGLFGKSPVTGKAGSEMASALAQLENAGPEITGQAPIPEARPQQPSTPGQLRGRQILRQALQEENINPAQVASNLSEARQAAPELPVKAMDVATKDQGGVITQGKNLIGLAKYGANSPGEGAAIAGRTAIRGLDQTKQLGKILDDSISNGNIFNMTQEALANIKANAPAAYAKAFESGDVEPIQKQLEKQLANIQQQMQDVQKSTANNAAAFYENQAAIKEAEQAAGSPFLPGYSAAKKQLADLAEQNKINDSLTSKTAETVAGFARQGQQISALLDDVKNGRATFAPGAVWSPRLQEFLDNPRLTPGMQKGWRIQRDEALAAGVPFHPKDYGITGFDANGDAIISNVPNMRLLDAGKKGMDAMIRENKNQFGQLNEEGRAIHLINKAYKQELDRLNPHYAAARKTFGDQASNIDAGKMGVDFMTMRPEEISQFFKDASTSSAEKAHFAAGVRQLLQDRLDRGVTVNQLWKDNVKNRLEPMFPNKEAFDKLARKMETMQDMQRTNNILAAGSHTAQIGNYGGEIQTPTGAAIKGLKLVKGLANPKGAILQSTLEGMSAKLAKEVKAMNKESAAEIMSLLMSDKPGKWREFAAEATKTGFEQKTLLGKINDVFPGKASIWMATAPASLQTATQKPERRRLQAGGRK